MTDLDTARRLVARGRPKAAARLLMGADDAAARALLDALPASGPHGVALAERLRFGPPETWRGWRRGRGWVAVKLWPAGTVLPPLAPVDHPGVAPLLGQGPDWRVFGWVAGETLATALRRGPVAPQVLDAVARAVAALHGAGLAHGDLKPANVVLPPGGGAALIDWGEDSAGTPGWRPAGPHDAQGRDLYALARLTSAPPAGNRPEAAHRCPPGRE